MTKPSCPSCCDTGHVRFDPDDNEYDSDHINTCTRHRCLECWKPAPVPSALGQVEPTAPDTDGEP